MTLNGLHSTILREISIHLDSLSTARLSLTSQDICSVLGTEAKMKRRLHCLRMALVRLRFIRLHFTDETILAISRGTHRNVSRERLNMVCVINLMNVYEYTGPPDYLYHFNPQCYDTLTNIVLHFEDHMNLCISNMYGMVRSTPTDILVDFMFDFDGIMANDP